MELHLISDPFKAEQERRRVNRARKDHGLGKIPHTHEALSLITDKVMSQTGAVLSEKAKGRGLNKAEFEVASTTKDINSFLPVDEDNADEAESTVISSPGKERVSKPTSTVGAVQKGAANEAFERAMGKAGLKAAKWAYGLVMHHERADGSFVPKTTAAKLAAEVVGEGGTWADLLERAKVVTA